MNNCFQADRFPHADYEPLYEALLILINHINNLEDEELNAVTVRTLSCCIPYLPSETILALPITLAEILYHAFKDLGNRIIECLVEYIIPLIYIGFTKDISDKSEEMNLCIPTLLAIVLDASKDEVIWSKVMECLMRYKIDVSTDLLSVLAYGTKESLESSVHLLNRYFPPVDIGTHFYDWVAIIVLRRCWERSFYSVWSPD